MNGRETKPRAYWQRKLERLLAPLIADPERMYPWRERWMYPPPDFQEGTFSVCEIHVFGSYARGAAEPGDLDLLVVIKLTEGYVPSMTTVKKVLFGQPRQVQVYVDHDESFRYRKQFAEHRLVWSRTSQDLHANLAAIPIVEGVGRFTRKTDALPVPLETLDTRLEEAEEVVDAIEKGELLSTLIPLDTITPAPDSWGEWLTWQARKVLENKKRTSVPAALQYLADNMEPPYIAVRESAQKVTALHLSGFYLGFRRPRLAPHVLTYPSVLAQLLVPDVPRGFAPAIWRLERGPNHPLVRALDKVELWFIARDGKPVFITDRHLFSESHNWHHDRCVLHAYSTQANALTALRTWKNIRAGLSVVAMKGAELLRWLPHAEDLFVNDVRVQIDHDSEHFLKLLEKARTEPLGFKAEASWREPAPAIQPTGTAGVYHIKSGGFLVHVFQKRSKKLFVLTQTIRDEGLTETDALLKTQVQQSIAYVHGAIDIE